MTDQPLKGLKVLELASVLAAPSAGMFLAELGAEVIKIENPATGGDVTRSWKLQSESKDTDVSAYFSSANWGKKSALIDLSQPEGQALVHAMIPDMDIVLASYKLGDDVRYRMDYDTLRQFRSDLIYASINGYGPNDSRIAYDAVLQAESGFMSMNGTPESGPLKMPVALIDLLASHQLKEAILLALYRRATTGEGSRIDVSLQESALASLANQATNTLMQGHVPGLQGSLHPNIAPYGETLRTEDERMIILAVGTDKQFSALCNVLGLNALSEDERFRGNVIRVKNRTVLLSLLQEAAGKFKAEYLLRAFRQNNIPAGLVQSTNEALKDAGNLILKGRDAAGIRQAVFLKERQPILPPPHAGEHTEEILTRYGSFSL